MWGAGFLVSFAIHLCLPNPFTLHLIIPFRFYILVFIFFFLFAKKMEQFCVIHEKSEAFIHKKSQTKNKKNKSKFKFENFSPLQISISPRNQVQIRRFLIPWIRFEVFFLKTPFSLISHLNSSSNLTKF